MSHVKPVGLQDTVSVGSSNTYTVWVKNYSFFTLSDSLTIKTAVKDSALNIGPANIVGTYTPNVLFTIAPQDSVAITLTSLYDTTQYGYRTGIDVIVVWPIASSATTVDSLTLNVYNMAPNGVSEINLMEQVRLFPNPTTDYLNLTQEQTLAIKSVRLYDNKGSEVCVLLNGNSINVEHLDKGVYSIDIEFTNKKHFKTKFIKQ